MLGLPRRACQRRFGFGFQNARMPLITATAGMTPTRTGAISSISTRSSPGEQPDPGVGYQGFGCGPLHQNAAIPTVSACDAGLCLRRVWVVRLSVGRSGDGFVPVRHVRGVWVWLVHLWRLERCAPQWVGSKRFSEQSAGIVCEYCLQRIFGGTADATPAIEPVVLACRLDRLCGGRRRATSAIALVRHRSPPRSGERMSLSLARGSRERSERSSARSFSGSVRLGSVGPLTTTRRRAECSWAPRSGGRRSPDSGRRARGRNGPTGDRARGPAAPQRAASISTPGRHLSRHRSERRRASPRRVDRRTAHPADDGCCGRDESPSFDRRATAPSATPEAVTDRTRKSYPQAVHYHRSAACDALSVRLRGHRILGPAPRGSRRTRTIHRRVPRSTSTHRRGPTLRHIAAVPGGCRTGWTSPRTPPRGAVRHRT